MTERQGDSGVHRATDRERSTESKSAYKTTELIVYVLAVLGVLIASRSSSRRPASGLITRGATSPTLPSAT